MYEYTIYYYAVEQCKERVEISAEGVTISANSQEEAIEILMTRRNEFGISDIGEIQLHTVVCGENNA